MISPQHVWPIASNTVREAIRSRVLHALLAFSIGVVFLSVAVAALSYVEGQRIVQDIALAGIRLFGLGIAVFVGIGLIHGEVERRTIYTILSKPITRTEFLLGKYFGLLLTVWFVLAIMGVAFALVSLGAGAPLDSGHLLALVMLGMELSIVVAIATLFSAFTTPMLASLYTLGVWAAGNLSRDLYHLGQQAESPALGVVATWLYRVLPDLSSFNLSIQAVHGLAVPAEEVWLPMLYGVGYTVALLIAAAAIFRRRDLK